MNITVNGKDTRLDGPVTIQQLLDQGYVEMQEYVTVQVNEAIIPRDQYKTHTIREGDRIEFLYYMGGGARM